MSYSQLFLLCSEDKSCNSIGTSNYLCLQRNVTEERSKWLERSKLKKATATQPTLPDSARGERLTAKGVLQTNSTRG